MVVSCCICYESKKNIRLRKYIGCDCVDSLCIECCKKLNKCPLCRKLNKNLVLTTTNIIIVDENGNKVTKKIEKSVNILELEEDTGPIRIKYIFEYVPRQKPIICNIQ
jgi:hypothetical protein